MITFAILNYPPHFVPDSLGAKCELRDVISTLGVTEISKLYPILHPLKAFRVTPLTFSIVATVFLSRNVSKMLKKFG